MMLLPGHRRVAAALLVAVATTAVFGYAVLLRMHREVSQLQTRITEARTEITRRGFPVNPIKLQKMQADLDTRKRAIAYQYDQVYDVAMRQFAEQMGLYNSVQGYRKSITQLDYQEKFLETRKKLAGIGVHLADNVLGLTETSSSPRNYQLYGQLLMVEAIASLARSHNLDLGDPNPPPEEEAPAPDARRQRPARISVRPVRMFATEQDDTPFAEEYPVKFAVVGRIDDFARFLLQLTEPPLFLPVTRVSVQKIGVSEYRSDIIEGTVSCSAFLMLRAKTDTKPPENEIRLNWHRGI